MSCLLCCERLIVLARIYRRTEREFVARGNGSLWAAKLVHFMGRQIVQATRNQGEGRVEAGQREVLDCFACVIWVGELGRCEEQTTCQGGCSITKQQADADVDV